MNNMSTILPHVHLEHVSIMHPSSHTYTCTHTHMCTHTHAHTHIHRTHTHIHTTCSRSIYDYNNHM